MDKDLEEIALDIITDPKVQWQQITGKSGWPFERDKYIADGYRNGKKLRVVFEPELMQYEGRGVLSILDLDARMPDNLSENSKKVLNILEDLSHYMQTDEVSLVKYFLYYEKPQLAFEVLCDIFVSSRVPLQETELQKIKNLSEEMNLNPTWTWQLLIYIDPKTQKERYALIDEESWQIIEDDLNFILLSLKEKLSSPNFQFINEEIKAGEYKLAIESIIWDMLGDKIKISRAAFNKLKELQDTFLIKLSVEEQAEMDQSISDE